MQFFNCKDEQGARQKATQKKNLKKIFLCGNRLARVYDVISM